MKTEPTIFSLRFLNTSGDNFQYILRHTESDIAYHLEAIAASHHTQNLKSSLLSLSGDINLNSLYFLIKSFERFALRWPKSYKLVITTETKEIENLIKKEEEKKCAFLK